MLLLLLLTTGAIVSSPLGVGATVLNPPARRPIVIIGVDGLAARSVAASPGFAPILENSSYTLRARAIEHTRSYEGWQAILMGGYAAEDNTYASGDRHPPLFTYIRSQMPEAKLWLVGRYYIVRWSINHTAADFYQWTRTAEETTDAFVGHVDKSRPPDLTVLYFLDVDSAGHDWGWDSAHYKGAVEHVAYQIKRVRYALPSALIFIVSDHGGRGGGHIYYGRDMRKAATDIDSPYHRDVPWIRYGDPHPRPLCDTIQNSETVAEVARALGIKPHPSWRTRGGWLPRDMPCTKQDVAPRTAGGEVAKAAVSVVVAHVVVLCAT